ncbi:hypothetical protein CIPAW_06G022100 [Carya illinoinensis]|uniref:Uncharacterized protein n=1 Tax=Carya illinoinensis TaxID=32201 RepID=A0A8T1Q6X9_CARIL|nr:hypothetical protein CIPAW_06G022100 [Carya illinoinensis]
MGKNVSNAKTFLEKRYTDDMELDDAVHTSILTLKEGFLNSIFNFQDVKSIVFFFFEIVAAL